MLAERTRPGACISDLLLDRWLARELSPAEESVLSAHAADCTRCHDRKALFAAEYGSLSEHIHFGAPASALRCVEDAGMRTSKTALRGAPKKVFALSLLAAAALCLLLIRPESQSSTRSKGGGPSISFFVKRGGSVSRGESEMRVAPGDVLRFTTSSVKTYYFAILSRDALGVVSIYAPKGESMQVLSPGIDRPLDTGVLLDKVLGKEDVFGLFCAEQHSLSLLNEALQTGAGAFPPKDCVSDTLTLRKEARP